MSLDWHALWVLLCTFVLLPIGGLAALLMLARSVASAIADGWHYGSQRARERADRAARSRADGDRA